MTPPNPPHGIEPVVERLVRHGELTLLRTMVEADIARTGETESFMVRSGLLLSIIDELQRARAALQSPHTGLTDVERVANPLACYDCGLPYGGPHWVEAVVPHDVWNNHLSPTGNEGGILCINCMAARAAMNGLRDVPCELAAGPFRAALSNTSVPVTVSEGMRERLVRFLQEDHAPHSRPHDEHAANWLANRILAMSADNREGR